MWKKTKMTGFENHIVYGVAGEGLGHSMRAIAVAPHLLKMGYKITFLVGDKSSQALRAEFGDNRDVDFIEIPLPLFVYGEDKNLDILATGKKFITGWPERRRASKTIADQLKGEGIAAFITDYEPITAWTAKRMGIPLIVLNSQDFYRYAHLSAIPRRFLPYFMAIKFTCWYFGFGRSETIVSHYDQNHIKKNQKMFLVGPMIRRSMREMQRSDTFDYTLVYIHPSVEKMVLPYLKTTDKPVYVHGLGERPREGNITFFPTDEQKFKVNFAGAKRVICCAGTTLPSECIYHRVPMLLVPMPGQKEQEFNAYLFSEHGIPIADWGNCYSAIPRFLEGQRDNMVDGYPKIEDGSVEAAKIINSAIWKATEN